MSEDRIVRLVGVRRLRRQRDRQRKMLGEELVGIDPPEAEVVGEKTGIDKPRETGERTRSNGALADRPLIARPGSDRCDQKTAVYVLRVRQRDVLGLES